MVKSITSRQKRQIGRLTRNALQDILERVLNDLTRNGAQRVVDRAPELRKGLEKGLVSLISGLAAPRDFEEETARPHLRYRYQYPPSGYTQPRPVTEQVARLQELFGDIGYANEALAGASVPRGAEGKFVILPWQSVAATYGEAIEVLLDKFRVVYGAQCVVNRIEGKLGAEYLREGTAKKRAFKRLAKQQQGFNLLVVNGQFGFLHRDHSARRARVLMEEEGQFGFGAFEVGTLLLTHPDRLMIDDDLWLDCPGDEYSPEADGCFEGAPRFFRLNDQYGFDTGRVDTVTVDTGSVSGWFLL